MKKDDVVVYIGKTTDKLIHGNRYIIDFYLSSANNDFKNYYSIRPYPHGTYMDSTGVSEEFIIPVVEYRKMKINNLLK